LITLTINDKDYKVKTSWKELKYIDYAEIKQATLIDRLAISSSVPESVLNLCTLDQINQIIPLIDWMEEEPEFAPVDSTVNIAAESYGHMEKSKQLWQKESNPHKAIIEIIKLYTGEDITNKSVFECYGLVDFFLTNSMRFLLDSQD